MELKYSALGKGKKKAKPKKVAGMKPTPVHGEIVSIGRPEVWGSGWEGLGESKVCTLAVETCYHPFSSKQIQPWQKSCSYICRVMKSKGTAHCSRTPNRLTSQLVNWCLNETCGCKKQGAGRAGAL